MSPLFHIIKNIYEKKGDKRILFLCGANRAGPLQLSVAWDEITGR